MDFSFPDEEDEARKVTDTTKPKKDDSFTLKSPSIYMNTTQNKQESSSPGKTEITTKKILTESTRRRKVEKAVPFLGTLHEDEFENHHRNHENRTGCGLNQEFFMEEGCTVENLYHENLDWINWKI